MLLHLDHAAFERDGILVHHRRVHAGALGGGHARALKLVCHLVSARDAKVVAFVQMGHVRDAQRECAALLDVLSGLVPAADVERHHVARADTAPRHVHDVDAVVVIVGGDHKHRHRVNRRLYAQVLLHGSSVH